MPGFVGTSGSEWTRTVIGLCDTRLSGTTDIRPLTGADTEDGFPTGTVRFLVEQG